MRWVDIPLQPTKKTLRQFAAVWLVFFMAIGALQYWGHGREQLGLVLGALAVTVGGPGLLRPVALRWLFVGWIVLAFPIGWLISQLALALVFYGVLTPVALIFRLRGRDTLCRRPAPGQPTFWAPKDTPQDLRSYFRQY
jgi:hypothetical protein